MSAAAGAAAASAARACLLVLLLVLTAAAVVSAMCTTLPPTPTNGVAYTTACSLPKQSGESCTTGCAAGYGYGSLSPPTAVWCVRQHSDLRVRVACMYAYTIRMRRPPGR